MAGVEEEGEGLQREAGLTAGEGEQARDVWRGGERNVGEDGEGAEKIWGGSKGVGSGVDVCGESGVGMCRRERVEGVGGKHREKRELAQEECGESGVYGEEGVCGEGTEREGARGRNWDREGVRGEEIEEEVGGVRGSETEEEVGGVRGSETEEEVGGIRGEDTEEEVGGVRGEETEEEVGGVRGEETEEGESGRGEGRAGRAWEEATGDDRLCTTEMKQENTHYCYRFNRCKYLVLLLPL